MPYLAVLLNMSRLNLKKAGYEALFYFYITIMIIMAFIALLFVPSVHKGGYLQEDEKR